MRIVFIVSLMLNILFGNEYLTSIYDNIVLKNSKESIKSVEVLQEKIKADDFKNAQKDFSNVVRTWKSVEAFYILGDLNEDYLDTPRYLDNFHYGNEDIKKQLDLIISDNEDLSISLYKNTHKTINALEYILFKKDLSNKRVKDIALIITARMIENLKEINQGYIASRKAFIADEKKANAIMLNSLIENSYKLKEWRIGDAAGLSRKYKKKPDNARAEYSISKNSQNAIKAIIDTHITILDKQDFKNYGSLISSYNINDELNDAIKYLNESKAKLELINNDDFSKAKPLYKSARKLHGVYYISLIGKLKVTAKVLDADGD